MSEGDGQSLSVQLCSSDSLLESDKGFRFPINYFGEQATAFVVRYQGKVQAYVNRCIHVSVELDWQHGEFFDSTKQFLMCSVHGYLYRPDNGICEHIRLQRIGLTKLHVFEQDGWVYWTPSDGIRPPLA
ncbi:Rieske (2Fe-2S) protein [Ampullimonas aquatilis]|uniref:Rieske (2Fe-2S) protein n=1 Tax=Ampullimonas aquatilis TaxID=1341549 RepID=UPI003C72830B